MFFVASSPDHVPEREPERNILPVFERRKLREGASAGRAAEKHHPPRERVRTPLRCCRSVLFLPWARSFVLLATVFAVFAIATTSLADGGGKNAPPSRSAEKSPAEPKGLALEGALFTYERPTGAESCPSRESALDAFNSEISARKSSPALVMTAREVRITLVVASAEDPKKRDSTAPKVIEGRIEVITDSGARSWSKTLSASPDECGALIASLAFSLGVAYQDPSNKIATLGGKTRSSKDFSNAELKRSAGNGNETTDEDLRPKESEPPIVMEGTPEPSTPFQLRRFLQPPSSNFLPLTEYRLWAGAAALAGAAPRAAARFMVGLSFHWGDFSAGIEFRGVPPATSRYSSYSVTAAHGVATFVPCVWVVIFSLCCLFSAGFAFAEGVGFDYQRQIVVRVSAGGRFAAEISLLPGLTVLTHLDIDGTFWPAVVVLVRRGDWEEATGQAAFGVAISKRFLNFFH